MFSAPGSRSSPSPRRQQEGWGSPGRNTGKETRNVEGSRESSSQRDARSWIYLSVEPTLLEVVFDDDVGDGVEDELDVLGVGGAGEVGVDLLGVLPLVQVLKLALDVASCLIILVGPWDRRDTGLPHSCPEPPKGLGLAWPPTATVLLPN